MAEKNTHMMVIEASTSILALMSIQQPTVKLEKKVVVGDKK